MQNLLDDLKSLLQKDERLVSESELLKNKIIELGLKLDKDLVERLLSDKRMKEVFFVEIGDVLVFDKDKFVKFVSNKQFLPDSYTAFKNKIGLTEDDEFIREKKEVALSWPYKDCVLEGGMTKEDQKRDEIFWNQTLAPDEISRLLDPKVFTNAKRVDKKGAHKLDGFKTDEKGDIKDNLIIKGNNLLALHSLKKRFAGKVKLIYIDPPYNTGNDSFGYNDHFNHSSWLTFMKNRLEVAYELLNKDGSIWINIDDNEAHYLKVLCDEIFGRENFVANVVWQRSYAPVSLNKFFSQNHDHVLVFSKKINEFSVNKLQRTEKQLKDYKNPDNDPRGLWKLGNPSVGPAVEKNVYKITTPSGRKLLPPKGRSWLYSREKFEKLKQDNRIWFGKDGNSMWGPKLFLSEVSEGITPLTLWEYKEVGHTQDSKKEVKRLFNGDVFSNPKPESLIHRIIHIGSNEDDIVLDFFAGSATTGAVAMKMKRQFILCEQMNYAEKVTTDRIKKVIAGEQGGISKEVGWKGGGDFVYMEMAKWNENFVDEIKKAKTTKELRKLWETMKKKAHLSYKVDPAAIEANTKEFMDLSVEDQKRFLYKCLDKNHLYVNYSEIDDEEYGVNKKDKRLNKNFYKDI